VALTVHSATILGKAF